MKWVAYRDSDQRFRLRKVVVEVWDKQSLVVRMRFFTSFFPRAKARAISRQLARLKAICGA